MPSQTERHRNAWIAIAVAVLLLTSAACNSQKSAAASSDASKPAEQTTMAASQPAPASPAPTAAATSASQPSPCDASANPQRCFFSDPFTVSIVNVDHTLAAYHIIRMNIEFRNVGKAPVTLAYQVNTGKAVDDTGNGYAVKSVPAGIPTDYGTRTDSRLTLQPGEAHMGTFEAVGYRTPKAPSSFNYDLTIDELGTDNPAQVLREHAVYFRDITPAMPGGGAK